MFSLQSYPPTPYMTPLNTPVEYCANEILTENLKLASQDGDYATVMGILKNDNFLPSNSGDAIFEAAALGYADILRLLLSDSRFIPTHDSLCYAAAANHYDTVLLLLRDGRVDPTWDGLRALRWANESGNDEVSQLIMAKIILLNKM
jgi:hypothetical protein